MKRSRTGSPAGKAPAIPPVATVQVPLPLLDVLADAKTAFFGLCLTAGQQVFQTLMEQDRAQLCGPKNVPNPDRQAYGQPHGEGQAVGMAIKPVLRDAASGGRIGG